jgi:hypothetical protein
LGEELMRCHRLLVNRFLDKIKKRNFINKKEGVITKKKLITPNEPQPQGACELQG